MIETAAQQRLHARHRKERGRVLGLLIADADAANAADPLARPLTRKLANRISGCGANPVAYWSPSDARLVVSRGMCKCRLCPTCAESRTQRMKADIAALAGELDSPRLMTLTLKSSDEPLPEQVKRLRACARRLRQRKAWKRHVQGGLMVVEVTYNARRDQWHPHLHLLIDATYWRQAQIADLWEEITGDSRIVDIRVCHSRDAAVRYVAKYVGKSNLAPAMPAKRVGEWAATVHGLRLFQTFGTLHARAQGEPGPPERAPLDHLAPLTPLFEACAAGDVTAQQLAADLRALRHSDDAEDHERVASMLRWWWEAFQAERAGQPGPAAPSTPPPRQRNLEFA